MDGKKREKDEEAETLQGCCSSASPDWCVCVWALATVARIAGAVRDACCRNVL